MEIWATPAVINIDAVAITTTARAAGPAHVTTQASLAASSGTEASTYYYSSNKAQWSLVMIMQRTHDIMITPLLRQSEIATPFWRDNDVIIALRVRWEHDISYNTATRMAELGLLYTKYKTVVLSVHYFSRKQGIICPVLCHILLESGHTGHRIPWVRDMALLLSMVTSCHLSGDVTMGGTMAQISCCHPQMIDDKPGAKCEKRLHAKL